MNIFSLSYHMLFVLSLQFLFCVLYDNWTPHTSNKTFVITYYFRSNPDPCMSNCKSKTYKFQVRHQFVDYKVFVDAGEDTNDISNLSLGIFSHLAAWKLFEFIYIL